MNFWYVVTHPFDGHHVGKRLTEVDESRVASNHVLAIPAPNKGTSPAAENGTAKPSKDGAKT